MNGGPQAREPQTNNSGAASEPEGRAGDGGVGGLLSLAHTLTQRDSGRVGAVKVVEARLR